MCGYKKTPQLRREEGGSSLVRCIEADYAEVLNVTADVAVERRLSKSENLTDRDTWLVAVVESIFNHFR